ncbi:O-antigen ligase family protein [Candidatus Sumerlaeota bacterium]|nr:O-antigen ligase family protein [Candidatus Sumerlaeota bacterium]
MGRLIAIILSSLTLPYLRIQIMGRMLSIPVLLILGLASLKIIRLAIIQDRSHKTVKICKWIDLLLYLFVICSFISTICISHHFIFLAELSVYVCCFLYITRLNIRIGSRLEYINVCFIIVTLTATVIGFSNYFAGITYSFSLLPTDRAIGTRNSDVFFASSGLCFAIPLIFYSKYTNISPRYKWIINLMAILYVSLLPLAVISSFSRSFSVVSFLCIAFIFLVYLRLEGKFIHRRMIVILALVFIFYESLHEAIQLGSFNILMSRFRQLEESERINLAIEAFKLGIQNPLFGIGLDNYSMVTNLFTLGSHLPYAHCHNSYLNLFAEMGVPGITIYSLFIFLPLYAYSKLLGQMRRALPGYKLIYLSGYSVQLFICLVSFTSAYYNYWYFWLLAAISVLFLRIITLSTFCRINGSLT